MSNYNPTVPTAVPWSPDVAAANTPAQPWPAPNGAAPYPQPHAPAQAQPAQQYPSPQAGYGQAAATYAQPAQMPQRAPVPQPQMHQPVPQPQMQPSGYIPPAQSPQHAPVPQPAHSQPPSAPPHMAQAAAAPNHMGHAQPYAPQPHQAQYAQPGQQPMPHAAAALAQPAAVAEKSKGKIGKLLQRSPKPADLDRPVNSHPVFNKRFIMGTVTGLILGAFLLPMVGSMVSGGTTSGEAQYQPASMPMSETTPAMGNRDTFIDNAIGN